MDLLKALKRTTYLTAAASVALFALGATEADAVTEQTAIIGHISASVAGTLNVAEISAINFGNFATSGACAATVPKAGTVGSDYVLLSDEGARTGHGCLSLIYGASGGGLDHTHTTFETGGQSPGFYSITGAINNSAVYVSFSDITGDIVDSCYGSQGSAGGTAVTNGCSVTTTYTHPNNYVTLTGPTANAFAVNEFVFETDLGSAGNGTSGYTVQNAAVSDATGNSVTLVGTSATLRVGGKLTPLVADPIAPGKYHGTFYVMVSY
jgi:hypothetical protein